MNIETVKAKGQVIYETIAGSHLYGLNVATSDVDKRGIFLPSIGELLSLKSHSSEVGDEKQDYKLYSIQKFFELAKDCNPNIVELLFPVEDCVLECSPEMQLILENRHLFVSKKAKHTFSGYAFAQIKKAKGQNKWVNNPQPKEPPTKEDFCYFIDVCRIGDRIEAFEQGELDEIVSGMPCRPEKHSDAVKKGIALPLSLCRVAAMEHIPNVYRLYEGGKGVFRDGQLVCDSIPADEEWGFIHGLLIYNETAYDAAMRDHKNYWEWMANRNEARWVSQEKGEVDFDVKNMMHCIRLLLSGINILKHGEPIVRFEGEEKQYLMDIRKGKFSHSSLMFRADGLMAELDELYKNSTIQNSVDMDKIDDLYLQVIGERASARLSELIKLDKTKQRVNE